MPYLHFSELSNFDSIESARSHLIWKEIDSLLRKSHFEHLKWIESKVELDKITTQNQWLNKFLELTERRNLFVHTDGVVNKHYLKNCSEYKIDVSKIEEHSILECDVEYFNEAS